MPSTICTVQSKPKPTNTRPGSRGLKHRKYQCKGNGTQQKLTAFCRQSQSRSALGTVSGRALHAQAKVRLWQQRTKRAAYQGDCCRRTCKKIRRRSDASCDCQLNQRGPQVLGPALHLGCSAAGLIPELMLHYRHHVLK
jgi:hypothetical protein